MCVAPCLGFSGIFLAWGCLGGVWVMASEPGLVLAPPGVCVAQGRKGGPPAPRILAWFFGREGDMGWVTLDSRLPSQGLSAVVQGLSGARELQLA